MVRIMSAGGPLDRGFEEDGTEVEYYPPTGCDQAVAFLRERGEQFAELAPAGASLSTGVGVDFGMREPDGLAE